MRSGKVCSLQSFGTIRLLPKFRTSDEMSHRETEGTEVLFKPTQPTEAPMVQRAKEYKGNI